MRVTHRLLAVAVFSAVAILALSDREITKVQAQSDAPTLDELVAWLDRRETEWLVTSYLQQMPDAAIPRLLQPGRAVPGPHDRWTPALLALAKTGERAIPAIVSRLEAIRRRDDRSEVSEAYGLVKVLGAIGPAAIPALVQLTESTPGLMFHSLGTVQSMEPRSTTHFGQILNPWILWRPADDRLAQLERAVVPMLPRIRAILDADAGARKARGGNWHIPAAYLLARWGTGDVRAHGRQVLEDTARSNVAFYSAIDAIRQLHALRDPSTAELIRQTARRIPDSNDLKPSYLLSMAIGLHQLGEKDYGPLVDEAIKAGLPHVRQEATRFLGTSGDLFNVARLVKLLEDRTTWSGVVVADVALASLRTLTLQDLPADGGGWQTWMTQQRETQRGALLERWISARRRPMATAPMWEANAWIAQLNNSGTDDARALPLIADYLQRKDLNARATGPNRSGGSGGGGPKGTHGPAVVTMLLRLAQFGVPGTVTALEQCVRAPDPEVRIYGALALAMYQRPAADEALAREVAGPGDITVRNTAAELLLELGDRRGLLSRLDAFERGAELYGMTNNGEAGRNVRLFACKDLRIYTQQPLPCDADAPADVRTAQSAAWRRWLSATGTSFLVPRRAAALDLEAFPLISPITIGKQIAR